MVAVVLFSIVGFEAVADIRDATFGAADVTRGAAIEPKRIEKSNLFLFQ